MYRKRKKDRRNLILITGLITIFLIIFILYIMNTKRNLNPVEKVIKDAVLSASSIISTPVNFISDKIKESKEKNNIYS